ncbi:hypothetical protein [Streptomyces kronopolitis]|uniref:hypothetical protein n=1 Tax=Streptomyces kronopolitis TaxID=1612435 RepID=UPI0036CCA24B
MRTRLAAGLVGAATVLTLFGGPVAAADGKDHATLSSGTPRTHDASPWMHDTPFRTYDSAARFRDRRSDRRVGRTEAQGRHRNNPLRMTACALRTALGALTGNDDACAQRLSRGYRT